MRVVEIYGRKIAGQDCVWCSRAKALLEKRGVRFDYHDITDSPELQDEFRTRTNGAVTVPQVFVEHHRIGGFTDLVAADRNGVLQQLVGGS